MITERWSICGPVIYLKDLLPLNFNKSSKIMYEHCTFKGLSSLPRGINNWKVRHLRNSNLFKESTTKSVKNYWPHSPLYLYFYLALSFLPCLRAHSSALISKHFMLENFHILYPEIKKKNSYPSTGYPCKSLKIIEVFPTNNLKDQHQRVTKFFILTKRWKDTRIVKELMVWLLY